MERKRIEIDYEVYEKLKFVLELNVINKTFEFIESLGLSDLYDELVSDIEEYLVDTDVEKLLEINYYLQDYFTNYEKCCNIVKEMKIYNHIEIEDVTKYITDSYMMYEDNETLRFPIVTTKIDGRDVIIGLLNITEKGYNIGNSKEYILKDLDFKLPIIHQM